jgi:hypothetical protein
MSDPQRLEQELREYMEKEPNLRREDRLHYLRAILNKHLEFNKLEHVITRLDLHEITSNAKTNFSNLRLPMIISQKEIESSDLIAVSVVEAVISYLNKNNLLKKLAKFDYR